jgi:hypothetical protein
MGKGDPIGDQTVNCGSDNVSIPQRANRVKTLLVGAVPKNIWAFHQACFDWAMVKMASLMACIARECDRRENCTQCIWLGQE